MIPQFLIPISGGYILERVMEFSGKMKEENAKNKSTKDYNILKNCFELLEKENNHELKNSDLVNYYHRLSDSNINNNISTYKTINSIVFKVEDEAAYIFPDEISKIIEKEKLEKESDEISIKIKEKELEKKNEEAEAAKLHKLKIEAELEETNVIKVFNNEIYNKKTEVRAFYGWGKYIEEKAEAITKKIKSKEAIEENTLLYGPAGCGKTSYVENVTKKIANQLNKNVYFYNIANSDLKTKTQNSATAHINQLFEQVHEKAKTGPVVLFFDEFDGISTKRESHNEKKQNKIDHQNNDVTAMLLQKIEKAAKEPNILIFAATNHIQNMDNALIRNGRFHRHIHIGKPNIEMRTEIINQISNKLNNEELNILLHLTSNQTTVEVVNTVDLYLKFKNENEMEEKNDIKKFAQESILAQNSRQKSNINDREIEQWMEKAKEKDSIKNLMAEEQKNPEIVSIQAIQDQEKYPSLKCNLEGLVSSEKINESYEEKMLKLLEHLSELKGLPRRFRNIDTELATIKNDILSISKHIAKLTPECFQGALDETIKTTSEENLAKMKKLIEKTSELNKDELLRKINNIEELVKTINTFEKISELKKKMEDIAYDTKQRLTLSAIENKTLLNTCLSPAEYRKKTAIEAIEKTKIDIEDNEKNKIIAFICFVTTAYDFNEYQHFLLTMLGNYSCEKMPYPISSTDVADYNKKIIDACNKLNIQNYCKIFTINQDELAKQKKNPIISKPASTQEIWNNLLDCKNYYTANLVLDYNNLSKINKMENEISENLKKLKFFLEDKQNVEKTFKDMEEFNTLISCLLHDQSLLHCDPVAFNFMYLKKFDCRGSERKILEEDFIIKDLVYDLSEETNRYSYNTSSYTLSRTKNRIKFHMKFFTENFFK